MSHISSSITLEVVEEEDEEEEEEEIHVMEQDPPME